jgi:hypothetical protein
MTNLIANFLASRAKQPITNEAQPVSRAEFAAVAKAVEILITDIDAALSPEKLGAVINTALKEAGVTVTNTAAAAPAPRLMPGRRAPLVLPNDRYDRERLMPKGD